MHFRCRLRLWLQIRRQSRGSFRRLTSSTLSLRRLDVEQLDPLHHHPLTWQWRRRRRTFQLLSLAKGKSSRLHRLRRITSPQQTTS